MASPSCWRCFRVPVKQAAEGTKEAVKEAFIGIVDASGSMRSCWPDVAKMYNQHRPKDRPCVTITFDSKPHLCDSNILASNIQQHGGGRTNISKAFEFMDKKMAEMNKDTHVTCLFISDGADNEAGGVSTLEGRLQQLEGNCGRQVTFICLGIQGGFPTFISMYLRELYHNTQSSIPALFLVEHASERAFFNKFEIISKHFSHVQKMRCEPACRTLPWLPPSNEVYENQVVLTKEQRLVIEGAEIELSGCNLSADLLAELFRGYVQELELLGLGPVKHMLKEHAASALELMLDLLADFKTTTGMDFLASENGNPKRADTVTWMGLRAKAMATCVRHSRIKVTAYVDNTRAMATGYDARQMGQYDAAKRIGVGTITGKQVQKALALKTVPLAKFTELKEDFANQIRSISRLAVGTETKLFSGAERVLRVQRDVFEADTLESVCEGLSLINSQFDLWEALPLVGVALFVKRLEGIHGDPWRLVVKKILRGSEEGSAELLLASSAPMAREYFKQETMGYVCQVSGQEANCVLPLYCEKDSDLRMAAQHPLMHILMGCNVTLNADGLHPEAYSALLASTFIAVLTPEDKFPAQAQSDLLADLCSSATLAYGAGSQFEQYSSLLQKDAKTAITTAADLSKPLFHAFHLQQQGALSSEATTAVLDLVGMTYMGRCIRAGSLADVLSLDVNKDAVFSLAQDKLRESFDQCYSLGDLRRRARRAVVQMAQEPERGAHTLAVKFDKLKEEGSKVNLTVLLEFGRALNLPEPGDESLLMWVRKAYNNNAGRAGACEHAELVRSLLKDERETLADELFALVKGEFIAQFRKVHQHVLPISRSKLEKMCEARGINVKKLNWDDSTCLVRNACLAPDCPFFLKKQSGDFIRHLGTWCQKLPRAFHKTVRAYSNKHPAFILAKFVSGDKMVSRPTEDLVLAEFDASEEWVMEYIQQVAQAYAEIDDGDSAWEIPSAK